MAFRMSDPRPAARYRLLAEASHWKMSSRHTGAVQLCPQLDRFERGRGVDGEVPRLVLDRRAVGVHEGEQRPAGVEVGHRAHADADRIPGGFEPGGGGEYLLPAVGTAQGLPQVGAVMEGVGHPALRESEEPVGLRVIDTPLHQRCHRPQLSLHLFDDLPVIDDLVLEGRGRGGELEQVVAPLGGHLRRRPGRQLGELEVVDGHPHTMLIAPATRVLVVEPGVEGGDEVVPLGDPQCRLALAAIALGCGRV